MNENETGERVTGGRPATSPPVLAYASILPGELITVGRYGSSVEASLPAAELAAEGIEYQVLNSNVNALGIPYSGFSDVEIQVRGKDAERALEVLARIDADDLEPAAEPVGAPPMLGDDGQPLQLSPVGAFDNARALRDAQTVLASAGIRSFPPGLVRRGDAPPGRGKRFFLRVLKEDFKRAETLLQEFESEAENEAEERCPKCGSWRVYPLSNFWRSLMADIGLGHSPEARMECLACHYRAAAAEFGAGKDPRS